MPHQSERQRRLPGVTPIRLHYASSSRAAPTTPTTSTTRPRIRPAGGRRPAVQRHRCGRPRGSVARAVALHCKSTAPGAATVRKEPYSRTLPGDRPSSFRRAGRSRPRAGRPRPALHPDGTTACPRPGARRRRLAKGSALSTTHRSLAAACSAARRRAAMAGSCCPSARQLLRRGAARRRARAHSVDGWTTVYDQDGRPRAMPDELVGAPANRCCALLRQHDEPPYTHCSHKNARRATRASHTHYRHTTSATRRPAREKRTAHFKFVCDRAPSNCAEPGSRRGRRHGLQLDGDGAASRRRYGGGRVYMELTIDGRASRPAGGLVWPDGVKASSMESPDGGTRPSGATEMALLDRPHDRRAVSFGPTA